MANVTRPVSVGILALGLLLAVGLGSTVAAPQGSADLQWVQERLKEHGFDPGRPNGERTARTKAALSAFQRSVGLPATGEADRATLDRLMAGRPASPSVGNLAAPLHGHGSAAGHDEGREVTPTVHAVPVGRVGAGGIGDQPMLGAGGVPRAAPSGTVSTQTAPGVPGAAGEAPEDGASGGALVVSEWVRDLVIGVIAAIFSGFAGLWWWSGRRPARPQSQRASTRAFERIEPGFAVDGRGRPEEGLRGERLR